MGRFVIYGLVYVNNAAANETRRVLGRGKVIVREVNSNG
jgi:hypothetical protein